MAGSARIGSLHVMLGLDSADFTNGMKKATTGLDRFVAGAKVGFAAVAVAAAAAGTALAVAVKGSIDRADDLSKTAQRIGTTTEALSRLEWAAKLSDVSLEQLSTGMKKLSQNMLEVSQGRGAQAKTAFEALGIAVTDASGRLRSSDAVFSDIAERFASMPDSAEKTALAMNLLGRSGADMIPLLNAGSQGLANMAAESDRLGNTISGNTGRAAEAFNDSLTRMQAVYNGIVNQIMQAVLPSLNELINTMASPEFAANAQQIAAAVVDAMKVVVDAVNAAVGAFNTLREAMAWASTHDMFGNKMAPSEWDIMKGKIDAGRSVKDALNSGQRTAPGADFYDGIFGTSAPETEKVQESMQVLTELSTTLEGIGASGSKAGGGVKAMATEVESSTPKLTKLQEAGQELAKSLASGLSDVFFSVIEGSKTAAQAVGDLLKSFARLAIDKGFQMLLGGMFGGGGFLGGLIPGFANGTNNAPGGLAVVGERGPELVNLPKGSQVIPNSALREGGGHIEVTARMEVINGNLVPVITQVAGQVSGQQIKANNKRLPSIMQDINMRQG